MEISKRSPFNLLQEIYSPDEWRIFVCCMMLNQTTRRHVDLVRERFFKLWPDANSARRADVRHMSDVIKSLGLSNRRIELYGLGKYVQDSYDKFLKKYLEWRAL